MEGNGFYRHLLTNALIITILSTKQFLADRCCYNNSKMNITNYQIA